MIRTTDAVVLTSAHTLTWGVSNAFAPESDALVRGADAWIAAGRLGGRPSTALRAGLRTRVRLGKSVHTVSAHDRMQQFTFNAWLPMNLMKRERSRDATHVAAGQSASAIYPTCAPDG